MKRWNTTDQMADDIIKMEVSKNIELNIDQCKSIARSIKSLYHYRSKEYVLLHIRSSLPYHNEPNGFTIEQKYGVELIVDELFRFHWLPSSRIRNNMIRIGAFK